MLETEIETEIKWIMAWLDKHDPLALSERGEAMLRRAEELDASAYRGLTGGRR
jgi:hypothetical protein